MTKKGFFFLTFLLGVVGTAMVAYTILDEILSYFGICWDGGHSWIPWVVGITGVLFVKLANLFSDALK